MGTGTGFVVMGTGSGFRGHGTGLLGERILEFVILGDRDVGFRARV